MSSPAAFPSVSLAWGRGRLLHTRAPQALRPLFSLLHSGYPETFFPPFGLVTDLHTQTTFVQQE